MNRKDEQFEPPYPYIRKALKDGKVIPFLGSGASLGPRSEGEEWKSSDCGFLPSAGELAGYLEHLSKFPPVESAELPRVAQYFEGIIGRSDLDYELHQIFAKDYQPMAIHYYLAESPANLLIVTTNYDWLLERAFMDRVRSFDLVVYNTASQNLLYWRFRKPQAQEGEVIMPESRKPQEVFPNDFDLKLGEVPVIYKMHGSADRTDPERDTYVITEDDYVEFLSRMASQTPVPAPFAEPFRDRHFLFLGYGLRDWNMRVILHKIWKEWPRRRVCWAIQHEAWPLERKFWDKRSLEIYELTIEEFLKGVKES